MPILPEVTIILVIWNAGVHLNNSFSALSKQTWRHFEIIVIDNGSTDEALASLPSWDFVPLTIKRLDANRGFAVANNIGAKMARGKWIILLNADAYPEPDWLEQLIMAADQNPQYNFFTSRQVQYHQPDLLDGAGDEYHVSGLAWRQFYDQPAKDYGHEAREVFGACAAAAMYRGEDFLKAGGFDEDYFSDFEDVDLSFRLRLAGGRCLYVPGAVVHHVGSASTGKFSDFVIYYGHRNLVWTYIKDMPTLLFWLCLPLHFAMNLFFLTSFIFRGKGRAIIKAKWDALRGIPAMWGKRKETQSTRTASVKEIYRFMSKGLLDPYWASRYRSNRRNNK